MENEKLGIIYSIMPKIMAEVFPIGKDSINVQQKYKFRGIDQVYNYMQPIFAKNGIFMRCEILEDKRSERQSKSGGILTFAQLRMRYYFVAKDGSSIWTDAIGEGADISDKAVAKAMSIAQKYAILQTFCIPTDDAKDPENESHQVNGKPQKIESETGFEGAVYDGEEKETQKQSFKTITVTHVDGKKYTIDKFEALELFQKMKKQIGDDAYYEILGSTGYEKSNEIPPKKIPVVYAKMVEAYQGK